MTAIDGADSIARDSLRRYQGWVLAALALALTASMVCIFADKGQTGPNGETQGGTLAGIGGLLYLALFPALIVIDTGAFVRAVAAHRWVRSVQGGAKVAVAALLYIFVVPYVVAAYPFVGVFQYARGYLGARQRLPLERRRHIAEMEAGLDIEPGTQGQCPNCGKPLQIDAEFCAFCGTRVKQEPVVCPRCTTVALPGAKWCPKCGAPLEGAPARI